MNPDRLTWKLSGDRVKKSPRCRFFRLLHDVFHLTSLVQRRTSSVGVTANKESWLNAWNNDVVMDEASKGAGWTGYRDQLY